MLIATTEGRILAAEAQLGVRLPAEYRSRLLNNNGGELTTAGDAWRVYPVLDDSTRSRRSHAATHLVDGTKQAALLPGFPPGAVAVASNKEGDLLVFLPQASGGLGGRLHVWHRESHICKPSALDYA